MAPGVGSMQEWLQFYLQKPTSLIAAAAAAVEAAFFAPRWNETKVFEKKNRRKEFPKKKFGYRKLVTPLKNWKTDGDNNFWKSDEKTGETPRDWGHGKFYFIVAGVLVIGAALKGSRQHQILIAI